MQADLHELPVDREELCGSMIGEREVGSGKRLMKHVGFVAVAAFVFGCARDQPAGSAATSGSGTDSSLYRRLGGYDAIAAVTDSFLARVVADSAINVFFAGIEPPHMNRVRQMIVDQLCAASGGPCLYVGKSIREAHATLGITSDAFERFIGHFQSTLAAFSVGQRERDEVIGTLRSLQADVVTK